MRFSTIALGAVLAITFTGAALAQSPPCASEAKTTALKLLKLHTEADERATIDGGSVRKIGTVKALVGGKPLDVLEVEGSVYKANYRIRLIYAQVPGSCLLMGQEIFERSNPY